MFFFFLKLNKTTNILCFLKKKFFFFFYFFFWLMENLGAMAYLRYTGFREITDHNVLELHCISLSFFWLGSSAVAFIPDHVHLS